MSEKKKIKIKLVKSLIGASETQRKNAKSLGLRKLNQCVEHDDTPTIRGMANAIPHLVSVD